MFKIRHLSASKRSQRENMLPFKIREVFFPWKNCRPSLLGYLICFVSHHLAVNMVNCAQDHSGVLSDCTSSVFYWKHHSVCFAAGGARAKARTNILLSPEISATQLHTNYTTTLYCASRTASLLKSTFYRVLYVVYLSYCQVRTSGLTKYREFSSTQNKYHTSIHQFKCPEIRNPSIFFFRPYASTTLPQVDVYTVHRVTKIVAGLSKIGIFVFTLTLNVLSEIAEAGSKETD